MNSRYDAVIVGSGPNGLAAAITIARAGKTVTLVEAAETVGGGVRSAELTLPGFVHDVCSAIHPFGKVSPFFSAEPLGQHGLEWIVPPAAVAHPLDDGTAVVLHPDIGQTADGLGVDRGRYRELVEPLVRDWRRIQSAVLRPQLAVPRNPLSLARFARLAVRSSTGLAHGWFAGDRARALFAGNGAHSVLPLDRPGSGGIGVVLTVLGHVDGWPLPRGGAGRIGAALAARLEALGGEIQTNFRVERHEQLPPAPVVLYDVSPTGLLQISGHLLPTGYRRRLRRFRPGPGVFKLDYALSEPIPWTARDCRLAATVHLGGTLEEIAASESAAWRGRVHEKPFVLVTQPSLFDPSRAPEGRHTAWAYCHVPNGSEVDRTEAVEAQIERFAPGFRECVLARHTRNALELETYNANCIGGDITGGANTLGQLIARPVLARDPYQTPVAGIFLCSASTPPGGGVHGMCGFHAANSALRQLEIS